MTPVIVALYEDYKVAKEVRTLLVADGFPTDRVELTSRAEHGQADAEPGESYRERVANYFHAIFDQSGKSSEAERFAQSVREGRSVITVHPRSDDEIDSARSILRQHHPSDVQEQMGT